MIVACVAVKDEPGVFDFTQSLKFYVDAVVVADETDGPHYGGGIGPSLQWAWGQALRLGADRVLQIDVGHKFRDIPLLVGRHDDVVIGSRFVWGSVYKGRRWRALCSLLYGFWQNIDSDQIIRDWTSGFRCFSRDAIEYLVGQEYTAKMHGWQAEVLHRALEAGFTVSEVPIRYTAGDSTFNAKHAWEAVKVR